MIRHHLRRTLIAATAALLFLQVTSDVQGVTAANSVTGLASDPLSPNILKFGQNITVSFHYDTNQAGGVRIFIRPITVDATGTDILTPNYAACGSPLYPVGSGTGSCTFTITDVDASVDKIRIQMWDANQTVKLFQVKLPVAYRYR
jgi:hypothetical protein